MARVQENIKVYRRKHVKIKSRKYLHCAYFKFDIDVNHINNKLLFLKYRLFLMQS
jgi:hypothetical protein